MIFQERMQFAFGIVQITKNSCLCGTYLETCRLQTFFQAMNAKVHFSAVPFVGLTNLHPYGQA